MFGRRTRRSVALLAAIGLIACASGTSPPVAPRSPVEQQAPDCVGVCPTQLRVYGPLADARGSGSYDASIRYPSDREIELVTFSDEVLWRVAHSSIDRPRMVASGDFTGDGIDDYVFRTLATSDSGTRCGSDASQSTGLLFIDGKTGAVSQPLPPMDDLCWTFEGRPAYATHQWGTGTVYIGDLSTARAGNEVIAFPYYASVGWMLNFAEARSWSRVQGSRGHDYFVFPSTGAYDGFYRETNGGPCSPSAGGSCYVAYSHVPNGIFVTSLGATRFMVLTSERALLYRPDLSPTADTTWISGGSTENGGRNYGLLSAFSMGRATAVNLIGGCGVYSTRAAMRAAVVPIDDCNIHRHYEFFVVEGEAIVTHESRYFSYSNRDGPIENRVEFTAHPNVPVLAAGRMSTVFNVYRQGAWRIFLLPDPSSPRAAIEKSGWYVWDAVDFDGSGQYDLLATRLPSNAAAQDGAPSRYLPPWEFDVLRWQGSDFVSVEHIDGYVPSLLWYPNTPSVHTSEGGLYGAFTRRRAGRVEVLVEDAAGRRSFLRR